MTFQTIAVFCGANPGFSSVYQHAAVNLATTLAKENLTLVYGGAKVGLMGILADTMLAHAAKVIGVIPKSLKDIEVAHDHLTELHVVDSMHQRKQLMSDLADGFIMMPGGLGSLDEFFEITTWAQLGYHAKPCAILNIDQYFDPLIKFLDQAVAKGFLKQAHRDMIMISDDANNILDCFKHYKPIKKDKWCKP